MIKRIVAVAGAAAVLSFAATSASAAPCAGFTDVDTASTFCPSVEWIKNRGITLGCTSSTLYCPGDTVTRLSMAAFFNRLGTALTPVFLSGQTAVGPTDITNPVAACQTSDYAVVGFPRTAVIDSWINIYGPNGPMDVQAYLIYSTNGGTTWTGINGSDKYQAVYSGATPPNDVTLPTGGILSLSVGATYRFGVALVRADGTGTSLSIYCGQRVQVISRDGASSPFDAPQGAQRQ
jgi:hypothetical protein